MTTEPRRMMDGYGSDEMALPIWKLCQSVGGDYAKGLGAVPGDFYCDLTEEIAKELEIIVVDIRKTRTYWGRTEIDDMPPECASADGKTSMEGEECAVCEHRTDTPWLLSAADRRNVCNISYNILGISFADSLPLLIRAGGISALPVRQLLTQLRLNKSLKGEYYRAIITVTSAQKKTPSGEAYNLHFKIKGLVEDQNRIKELKQESAQLLGAPMALPESREDEEEVSTPAPTERVPLGYLPDGTPYFSEAEKEQLVAQLNKKKDPAPAKKTATQKIDKPAATEAKKGEEEPPAEQLPPNEPLNLDF